MGLLAGARHGSFWSLSPAALMSTAPVHPCHKEGERAWPGDLDLGSFIGQPLLFVRDVCKTLKVTVPRAFHSSSSPDASSVSSCFGAVQSISSGVEAGMDPGAAFSLGKPETHLHAVQTGATHFGVGKKFNNRKPTCLERVCLQGNW